MFCSCKPRSMWGHCTHGHQALGTASSSLGTSHDEGPMQGLQGHCQGYSLSYQDPSESRRAEVRLKGAKPSLGTHYHRLDFVCTSAGIVGQDFIVCKGSTEEHEASRRRRTPFTA